MQQQFLEYFCVSEKPPVCYQTKEFENIWIIYIYIHIYICTQTHTIYRCISAKHDMIRLCVTIFLWVLLFKCFSTQWQKTNIIKIEIRELAHRMGPKV